MSRGLLLVENDAPKIVAADDLCPAVESMLPRDEETALRLLGGLAKLT